MNTQSIFYDAVAAVLRIVLVMALVAVVWNVYRHLPDNGQDTTGNRDHTETSLKIILRDPSDGARATLNLPLELFPIDITAVQNEFLSERRPGKRLNDFLAERMGNRAPVEAHFDENGEVTVKLKPGPWWIHTTLPGQLNIEWRLRVNVSGNKQTVELTQNNAYTRSRSF